MKPVVFFETAVAVAKIGSSVKPNYHNIVQPVQIPDMHCRIGSTSTGLWPSEPDRNFTWHYECFIKTSQTILHLQHEWKFFFKEERIQKKLLLLGRGETLVDENGNLKGQTFNVECEKPRYVEYDR